MNNAIRKQFVFFLMVLILTAVMLKTTFAQPGLWLIAYVYSLTVVLDLFYSINGEEPKTFSVIILHKTLLKFNWFKNLVEKNKSLHLIPIWMRGILVVGPCIIFLLVKK